MIKLIASDLDGTLLDNNSQLSKENRDAVAEALAQGITFTLSTGRMFQSAAPFARDLGLGPQQPLICYNGALIRRLSGEILYEQPLAPELSQMVVDYGQRRGWTINAYFQDQLYVSAVNQKARDYALRSRVSVTAVGDLVHFVEEGKKCLSKLMIIGEAEETLGRIEELRSLVGEELQIVRSQPHFVEVTNIQAHKGQALKWLAESMGLEVREIMAIGDSNNDLTMIQVAGIGVAVGNAGLLLQENADYVTSSNQEHGVARAIERFALQR
ncbi:MAG: Cof-type HAD-IIB family hydrolase [Limnochordia bacterium]|jgi:Cof subfamily protein (haloacid dehalogenase superfamily)